MSMYSKSLSNDDELVPVGNPRTWVPYMNTRDCSQGFCSLYCPQWCYIIFPPPPPFEFPDDDDSAPNFSPLVIAIIGILASAFLLVSYYAIISKYCGRNRNATPRRRENHQEDSELDDDEAWHATTGGLDEALIKSITVFKYKKGDGLTEGGTTDCSVCLSEFEQDESLRLLPKCNHAFHVMCIDTWLKSHSNCPLCRANITFPSTLPPQANEITPQPQLEHHIEMGNNVREEAQDVTESRVRRSVSMDDASQARLSIADILKIEHDQDCQMEEYCQFQRDVGTSKQENRSLSSGRFLFSKRGRGQNCMLIPMSNI